MRLALFTALFFALAACAPEQVDNTSGAQSSGGSAQEKNSADSQKNDDDEFVTGAEPKPVTGSFAVLNFENAAAECIYDLDGFVGIRLRVNIECRAVIQNKDSDREAIQIKSVSEQLDVEFVTPDIAGVEITSSPDIDELREKLRKNVVAPWHWQALITPGVFDSGELMALKFLKKQVGAERTLTREIEVSIKPREQ